ncbi:hypothetical protein [Roseomonas indoligenes]|uniref:YcxB-like protein domain-containing protein n=1 Tax=Roseomonas indoligenes TaxID=2820811 RepID=A0A940N008_9PROT|nr:hypothetical protein [Pararoseomonas indoligenes]MBP0494267.1 hypothetical protein [Pararoseomonas indoligenes]
MSEGVEAAAGPPRYALQVPALGLADYGRMQVVLMRAASVRPGWRRRLLGLAGGCLVGGTAGYLAASREVSAEMWLVSGRDGWAWSLDGFGLVLAVLGVVLATVLALGVILSSRQRRGIHALHAAAGDLLGAHELLLGEDGLLWRNPSRTLLVPWSRVTGAVRQGGMLLIIADRISAFWLPEALIAAHPDRAGLESLLRRHGALP